ncbi:MAG: cupredoxin domain-containing protein [Actinobacteria bacterium]|nr:cupredoxin domain-containing protein [Actinomycetota bacterium]
MRRLVIILAVVCGLIPACGRGQNPSLGADDASGPPLTDLTVTAKNTAFSPDKLTAAAGKELTITFKNDDTIAHSFHLSGGTAGEIKTDIKPGPSSDQLKVTLNVPAAYGFRCDVHATMTGRIIVVKEEKKG